MSEQCPAAPELTIAPEEAASISEAVHDFLALDNKDIVEQIGSIPNIVSAVSGIATWKGAEKLGTLEGLLMIVAGRTGDVIDGKLARWLNQSSQFGAAFDASIDKIVVGKLLYEAWRAEAVPRKQLALILGTQALNTTLTTIAFFRDPHQRLRPTKTGKYTMAAQNLCLFSHIAGHTFATMGESGEYAEQTSEMLDLLGRACHKLGDATAVASMPLAATTAIEYAQRIPHSHGR
ncbi:MAG: CDP-alcohol phosphatidyltransferase family protein [Candidatus Saccharibacteria bacterium]|nr:CDP-alcohol phosphatidyltransferase family protein [Candidatus Saccharibacteria bacterium]